MQLQDEVWELNIRCQAVWITATSVLTILRLTAIATGNEIEFVIASASNSRDGGCDEICGHQYTSILTTSNLVL